MTIFSVFEKIQPFYLAISVCVVALDKQLKFVINLSRSKNTGIFRVEAFTDYASRLGS